MAEVTVPAPAAPLPPSAAVNQQGLHETPVDAEAEALGGCQERSFTGESSSVCPHWTRFCWS